MSPKLAAFTYLRSHGLIEAVKDVEYCGVYGGDHIFTHTDGSVISVDLVIEKHRVD